MAAKDVRFSEDARLQMVRGVNRGGLGFSDTGISGFLSVHDRREVRAKAKTEPFSGVQGASGFGSDPRREDGGGDRRASRGAPELGDELEERAAGERGGDFRRRCDGQ